MIVCNIRVLRAPLTGVQRYTLELLKRKPDTVRTVEAPEAMKGSFLGHVWEQAVLPFEARGHLLWSPASTGPICVKNQVVTVHDIAPIDCPEGYSPCFRRWYGRQWRLLLPRVRGIISVSEFTKRRLIETFGLAADTIDVTPLGVDHDRFFPQPPDRVEALRRKLSLPENFAVFVGALSARKNIIRLLEAWPQCRQAGFELVIAGGGGPNHVLAGTNAPTLPPNARLLGRIDDADLPTLLTAAGAFVYPSLYEGFGLPPLEAMANRTPVIASNTSSLPEVLDEAALLVNPENVFDIARGMKLLLLEEVLRQKFIQKGIEQVARFSWKVAAQKVLETYEYAGAGQTRAVAVI
jgi:glycosyltransferase involved in cell wall biosynthesis